MVRKGITHLIPENIAPKGAKSVKLYNSNGAEVLDIPLGRLTPPTKQKLYSFGLLSDVHMGWLPNQVDDNYISNRDRFENALEFLFNPNYGIEADFCCHCGDITDYGLWYPATETTPAFYQPKPFQAFLELREYYLEKYNKDIFGNCGNHESYGDCQISEIRTGVDVEGKSVTVNGLAELKKYTGRDLWFVETKGNDAFIFIGQSIQARPMSIDGLGELENKLVEYANYRCFVFIHPHISKDDSGNPNNGHNSRLCDGWEYTERFKNALKTHGNVILFHGHSHVHFSEQEKVSHAIYSKELEFHSVHVPSLANGRKLEDDGITLGWKDPQYSLGYLVDVYDDCIVLNGIDFTSNSPVPIGTYKIDITTK